MSVLLLRTTIRKETKRKALFYGLFLAFISLFGLWLVEFFMLPLVELESLGVWGWIFRACAVGSGFAPYKKIFYQKNYPDILKSTEDTITLSKEDAIVFTLPWGKIKTFTFIDKGTLYGIIFSLKNESHDPKKLLQRLSRTTKGKEEISTIFLPYFSERSYLMLEQWHKQNIEQEAPLEEERIVTSSSR